MLPQPLAEYRFDTGRELDTIALCHNRGPITLASDRVEKCDSIRQRTGRAAVL